MLKKSCFSLSHHQDILLHKIIQFWHKTSKRENKVFRTKFRRKIDNFKIFCYDPSLHSFKLSKNKNILAKFKRKIYQFKIFAIITVPVSAPVNFGKIREFRPNFTNLREKFIKILNFPHNSWYDFLGFNQCLGMLLRGLL